MLKETVVHPKFGKGKVTGLADGRVTVLFGAPTGEKSFIYPDAFNGFLTCVNVKAQAEVDDALLAKRMEARQRSEQLASERAAAVEAEKAAAAARKKPASRKKTAVKKVAPAADAAEETAEKPAKAPAKKSAAKKKAAKPAEEAAE